MEGLLVYVYAWFRGSLSLVPASGERAHIIALSKDSL